VLRLFVMLMTVSVALAVFLTLDYTATRKRAAVDDPVELTIEEYLRRLPDRFARTSTVSGPADLPTKLVDMLPQAPEGWTVRPALAEDADIYQPPEGTDVERAARRYVEDVGSLGSSYGPPVEMLTYEKGDQRVMFRAIRLDDEGYGEDADPEELFAALTAKPSYKPNPVVTVRGLDVTEDILPEGFRARLFMAHVGGQIELRILTPRDMTDRELVPFLATLNVAAMNAIVVRSEPGLGQVPLIQIATQMDEAGLAAYLADRTARELAREDAAFALLPDGSAQAREAPPEAETIVVDCTKSVSSIKRCKVAE